MKKQWLLTLALLAATAVGARANTYTLPVTTRMYVYNINPSYVTFSLLNEAGEPPLALWGSLTTTDIPECQDGMTCDATMTFPNGSGYLSVEAILGTLSGSITFSGSITIPSGFTGLYIYAPVTFSGSWTAYQLNPNDQQYPYGTELFSASLAASTGDVLFGRTVLPTGSAIYAPEAYAGDTTADAILYVVPPVPEPGTLGLLGLGLLGLCSRRRWRRWRRSDRRLES